MAFNVATKIEDEGFKGKEAAFMSGFESARIEGQLHIDYLENELRKAKDKIVSLTDNNK